MLLHIRNVRRIRLLLVDGLGGATESGRVGDDGDDSDEGCDSDGSTGYRPEEIVHEGMLQKNSKANAALGWKKRSDLKKGEAFF